MFVRDMYYKIHMHIQIIKWRVTAASISVDSFPLYTVKELTLLLYDFVLAYLIRYV